MKGANNAAIIKSFIAQYTKDDTRKAIVGWSVAINVVIFNIAFIQTINYFLPADGIARALSYWCLWAVTMLTNLMVFCCYNRECLCFRRRKKKSSPEDLIAAVKQMSAIKPESVAINIKAETKLEKPPKT